MRHGQKKKPAQVEAKKLEAKFLNLAETLGISKITNTPLPFATENPVGKVCCSICTSRIHSVIVQSKGHG